MQCTAQTHSRILPDPWRDVGPGLCFLSPTDAAVFSKTGPDKPCSHFLWRSSLMATKEVQPLYSSKVINNISLQMLQFKFSFFYVKEEKGPISKRKKKSEFTPQIVTDLLLFITVNMYWRKHINVFS